MLTLYTLSFVFFVLLTGLAVVASGLSIVVQARLPKVFLTVYELCSRLILHT
jgi:hypothetical protein